MGSIDAPEWLKKRMKDSISSQKPSDENTNSIPAPDFLKKKERGTDSNVGGTIPVITLDDSELETPSTLSTDPTNSFSFKRRGQLPDAVKKTGGVAIVKTPEVLFSGADKEVLQGMLKKNKITPSDFNPINEIKRSAGLEELITPETQTLRPYVNEITDANQLEKNLSQQAIQKRKQLSTNYFKDDAKTINKTKAELTLIEDDLKVAQTLKKKAAAELTIEGEDEVDAKVRTDQSGNLLNKVTNRLLAISPTATNIGIEGISQETQDKIEKLPSQFITGLNYIKNVEPVVFERISDALLKGLPISESQIAGITQQGLEIEQARLERKLQKQEITPDEFNTKANEINTVRQNNVLNNEETLRAFLSDGAANILDDLGKKSQEIKEGANTSAIVPDYLFGHTWNYSDEQIKYATEKYAKQNGLDPQDARVQKAIKYLQDNEGAMIMENSIAKAGGIRELFKGLAEPIRGISATVEDIGKTPNDVYVEGQSQGNVNVSEKRLKAEDLGVRGIVNDVVKGTGQFVTQAGLAYLTSGAIGGVGRALIGGESAAGATAAGETIGNALMNTKDGVATFITSYGQAYDSNLKNALNYTSNNQLAKNAAAINSAIEGATELFLSPLDVAKGIASKFKSKGTTEGLLKVLSEKNLMQNPDKLRDFLTTTLKGVAGTAKVSGAEIGEEFVTNIADFVTNAYLNPDAESFQNRDLQNELAVTAYQTGLSMAIPALLNGIGAANANTFSKGSLLVSAQNRQRLIDGLTEDLALNNIDQAEYNQKVQIVNTAAVANSELPLKSDGNKLNTDEKSDYIYSRVSENVMKDKIETSKDEAEKRILEKKIKEQQDFRTALLGDDQTQDVTPVYKVDGKEVDKATFLNTAKSEDSQNFNLEVINDAETQGFLRSIGGIDEATEVITDTAKPNTETALEIVNTLQGNENIPSFEFTAMVAQPEQALQGIADQALGFGRDADGNRLPLDENTNEPQLEAVTRKFGKEVVDKAIAMFPAENISSPSNTQNVQESNSQVVGQEIGSGDQNSNQQTGNAIPNSENPQRQQEKEVVNNAASNNTGAATTTTGVKGKDVVVGEIPDVETHESVMSRAKTGEPIEIDALRIQKSDDVNEDTGGFYGDKGVIEEYQRRQKSGFYGKGNEELFKGDVKKRKLKFENPLVVESKEEFIKELAENGDKEAIEVMPDYKESDPAKLTTTHKTHKDFDTFIAKKAREKGYDGIITPLEYVDLRKKSISTNKEKNSNTAPAVSEDAQATEQEEVGNEPPSGDFTEVEDIEDMDVSGIRKALVSDKIIADLDLERISDKEMMATGRKILDTGEVKPEALVTQIITKGAGVLTPTEVVALITYKRDIDNALQDTYKEINNRTEKGEDIGTLGVEAANLERQISDFDVMAVITAQQQSMAFRLRQRMLDRDYNVVTQIERYKKNNNGEIPADVEAKFRDLDKQLKEVKKKLSEAEEVAEEIATKAAIDNIKESVDREKVYTDEELDKKIQAAVELEISKLYEELPSDKKSVADKAISALEKFRAKIRNKAYDATLGIPAAIVDLGTLTAIRAIKVGKSVAEAVRIGIKRINDALKAKGINTWYGEEAFTKDMTEFLESEGVSTKKKSKDKPTINDDGTVSIPNEMLRDLVRRGVTDINELTDAVHEQVIKDLPDISKRQVRDYITDYGKQINPTADELQTQVNTAKRIGRLLSELEDTQNKIKKTTGNKKTLTDKERELKRQINSLRKDVFGKEEKSNEQKLSDAKENIKSRIAELNRRIKNKDFAKPIKKIEQTDAELVTLNAQKEKLQEQFDDAQYKLELKNRTFWKKAEDIALELTSGLVRGLVASIDLSAGFVQGFYRIFSDIGKSGFQLLTGKKVERPKSLNAFGTMFKHLISEKGADNYLTKLKSNPAYNLMIASKLAIDDKSGKISAKEGLFISNWINLIWDKVVSPVLGIGTKQGTEFIRKINPYAASQRAFDGYVNSIRVQSFLQMAKELEKDGYTFESDDKVFQKAADFVNTTTGRGSLGAADASSKWLNIIMFAPRKVISEIKLFTPYAFVYYARMPKSVRKKALLNFASFAITYFGVNALIHAALAADGDDDDDNFWNMDSSEFMTHKIGNNRVNIGGGMKSALVFQSRLWSGKFTDQYGKTNKLGERFGKQVNTRLDLIWRFALGKASPALSVVSKKLDERKGIEVDDADLVKDLTVPIWMQDVNELYKEQPETMGAFLTILSIFGANVRTVEEKNKK